MYLSAAAMAADEGRWRETADRAAGQAAKKGQAIPLFSLKTSAPSLYAIPLPLSCSPVSGLRPLLPQFVAKTTPIETDGKKPKGVKRLNDLINFDVDIHKLIRHLD